MGGLYITIRDKPLSEELVGAVVIRHSDGTASLPLPG
jgi:hypothetical protein